MIHDPDIQATVSSRASRRIPRRSPADHQYIVCHCSPLDHSPAYLYLVTPRVCLMLSWFPWKVLRGYTMSKVGRYRHHKGKENEMLGCATHPETAEELVVYRALGNYGLWIRPKPMFLE